MLLSPSVITKSALSPGKVQAVAAFSKSPLTSNSSTVGSGSGSGSGSVVVSANETLTSSIDTVPTSPPISNNTRLSSSPKPVVVIV